MKFRDYYAVLGVPRDAGPDDIKRAWRRQARKYHPDVSREPDAELRMKELNEAFEVLSDPDKRAAYDGLGQRHHAGEEFQPPPDWEASFDFSGAQEDRFGPGDFSEFFETLFGAGRGMPGRRGGFDLRGEDQHATIEIELEDSFHGTTRELALRTPQADARGRVRMHDRVLQVAIPRGVREGQQIRLAGQGAPAPSGGAPGDLYLQVRFRPHRLYRADGADLYLDLPVAPWEAALGASVRVPTPSGTVELKVPPHSASGRRLRLPGRGLPGRVPGDLYAVLQVVLPRADTPRARAVYETMARELACNPRAHLET